MEWGNLSPSASASGSIVAEGFFPGAKAGMEGPIGADALSAAVGVEPVRDELVRVVNGVDRYRAVAGVGVDGGARSPKQPAGPDPALVGNDLSLDPIVEGEEVGRAFNPQAGGETSIPLGRRREIGGVKRGVGDWPLVGGEWGRGRDLGHETAPVVRSLTEMEVISVTHQKIDRWV